MSLLHAKHNERLCRAILKNGKFPDWVITTAFYSSIHYIYSTFPHTITFGGKTVTYRTFAQYYNDIKYGKHSGLKNALSKHEATVELTEEFFPEFSAEFKMLKETCHSARYIDYKVNADMVKLSVDCLNEIKVRCIAN